MVICPYLGTMQSADLEHILRMTFRTRWKKHSSSIAYSMLCKDLSTIRQWIVESWHKLAYEDNSDYDWTGLAVVSNTAVELGREPIIEFMPVLKKHGCPREMAQRYLEATTSAVF